MKFQVTMKDPDTLHDAIADAVKADVSNLSEFDADEKKAVSALRANAAAKVAGRWFKYSEYLTVEIDTDAGTCVVVPAT